MWILLIALLLIPAVASGATCSGSSCTFTVVYDEPTKNADGSAVQLQKTTIYYRLGSAAEKKVDVPPTGGRVTKAITEAVAPGATVTMTAQSTATNTAGAESARSNVASETVTNTAAPADPPPPDPQAPVTGTPVLAATTADYPMTWPAVVDQPSNQPVPTYSWSGGYSDGSSPGSGTVQTNSVTFKLPYHTSGQGSAYWWCYQPVDSAGQKSANSACTGGTSPAKPVVTYKLTVAQVGQGTVTGAGDYPAGTVVNPTATPAPNWQFETWSGACSGKTCSVTMDAAKSVTATFTAIAPTTPPAPQVAQSIEACTIILKAAPPDATTGWSARFRMDGNVAVGSVDTTVDSDGSFSRYKKDIQPGTHWYYVEWLKGNQVQVTSSKAQVSCP